MYKYKQCTLDVLIRTFFSPKDINTQGFFLWNGLFCNHLVVEKNPTLNKQEKYFYLVDQLFLNKN